MCEECQIPAEVSDEETIARVLFSPSTVVNDKVTAVAFKLRNLRPPEDYVSVNRSDYMEMTPENVANIKPPAGNTLYGYALLNVGTCREISVNGILTDVTAHPTTKNPAHAGIHFSKERVIIKGECEDPDFILLTAKLAKECKLVKF